MPSEPFNHHRPTLRMSAEIDFANTAPSCVFDIMGDPRRITDWYLLADQVNLHEPGPMGEQRFDVVLTFFGVLFEEVLEWRPPKCYHYKASGPDFPIRDYEATIKVHNNDAASGTMRWNIYFDHVDGENHRRILPVMLPPVMDASIERLAPLIGGIAHRFDHDMDGLKP